MDIAGVVLAGAGRTRYSNSIESVRRVAMGTLAAGIAASEHLVGRWLKRKEQTTMITLSPTTRRRIARRRGARAILVLVIAGFLGTSSAALEMRD